MTTLTQTDPPPRPADLSVTGRVGGTIERFFAPALPLARVAWLRLVIYPFVIWDATRVLFDSLAHGDVPAELYQGLVVRDLLFLPAPSPVYVRVVLAVLVVSAVVAAIGRLPRLAGWVCAFAMLDWTSNAFAYSKVDHDHYALIVALFVLPSVGRATLRDHDVLSQAAGWALRLVQISAISIYAMSAWAKMRFGGWGWANGATLIWALTRRPHGLAPWIGEHTALAHGLQWTVLVAEFCSPVVLWLRGRALYAALVFWGVFHLSTFYLLRIHFLPLVVCLFAFLPLERLSPPVLRGWDRLRGRARGARSRRVSSASTAPSDS